MRLTVSRLEVLTEFCLAAATPRTGVEVCAGLKQGCVTIATARSIACCRACATRLAGRWAKPIGTVHRRRRIRISVRPGLICIKYLQIELANDIKLK